MTSLFSFLHNNLKVTPLDDGQVEVTVNLPSDLFLHYIRLFDSLTGFIQTVDRKARLTKTKATEDYQNETKRNLERYQERLVQAYDLHISNGLNRNAAIKQISTDLRSEKHPWSSPDLVRPSLIAAGRSGRIGRPRRQL